jgi:hypothetical protein
MGDGDILKVLSLYTVSLDHDIREERRNKLLGELVQ